MEYAVIIGLLGWLLALIPFIINFRENKRKNDDMLLEKTLKYFERGTIARSMGISLVDAIWFQRKKHLDVIVPVLINQAQYLFTEADDYANERRNLIRLLFLIEKCLPYSVDSYNENIEITEIILSAATSPGKIILSDGTLKIWYSKFNNGNTELFDAEVADS
ncbi:hypothetical protein CRU96_07050 [Malaciobacter halophilus]|nr:hypothetical protein CRU96_07050 [Malaciobacter halophilus]